MTEHEQVFNEIRVLIESGKTDCLSYQCSRCINLGLVEWFPGYDAHSQCRDKVYEKLRQKYEVGAKIKDFLEIL